MEQSRRKTLDLTTTVKTNKTSAIELVSSTFQMESSGSVTLKRDAILGLLFFKQTFRYGLGNEIIFAQMA